MRNINLNLIPAALLLAVTGSAFAANTSVVTFTGNIIAGTCEVVSGSATKTVELETAKISDFASSTTAKPIAFSIDLEKCEANAKVNVKMTGTSAGTGTGVLKNTDGTAANVGVQVLKAPSAGATTGGTALGIDSTVSVGTASATAPSSMSIPFIAQYYKTGAVGAGTVKTVATLNFIYN